MLPIDRSKMKKPEPRTKISAGGKRIRLSHYYAYEQAPKLSLPQQIKLKCLDCCGGEYAEVTECPAETCPLWTMRLGRYTKTGEYWTKHHADYVREDLDGAVDKIDSEG